VVVVEVAQALPATAALAVQAAIMALVAAAVAQVTAPAVLLVV
jgi:hypothetical protein